MRAITSEIARQPALWRKAADIAPAVAGLLPAPGDPAMECCHGPISVAGPGTVVWASGPVDPGVLADAANTGGTDRG